MERCCVFSQNEKDIHFNYEVIKRYDWCEDELYNESFREFVKCKDCGALFIHQATAVDENYSAEFMQVEDEAEADDINQKNRALDFSFIEQPKVAYFKGDWYFKNLKPLKVRTREETLEEIKKMTLEEKVEEWKDLLKNLGDFSVHGTLTDSIELVIDVIKSVLEEAELTGGMTEPYKSDFERLIKDYEELYKVREKEDEQQRRVYEKEKEQRNKMREIEEAQLENDTKELIKEFEDLFKDLNA